MPFLVVGETVTEPLVKCRNFFGMACNNPHVVGGFGLRPHGLGIRARGEIYPEVKFFDRLRAGRVAGAPLERTSLRETWQFGAE